MVRRAESKKSSPPNRIAEWRTFRGLTQDELAERVGTTSKTISQLERGSQALKQHWLERIAAALDTTKASLLDDGPAPGRPGADQALIEMVAAAAYGHLKDHGLTMPAASFGRLVALLYRNAAERAVSGDELERIASNVIEFSAAERRLR